MTDQCHMHDTCVGEIRGDIREIKEMLGNGRVVHEIHELRLNNLENSQRGWNLKGNILRFALGLVEKAILVGVGLATWALVNGGLNR